MNPHIFREYDIRGVVDQDLTDEGVTDLGRAFGTYLVRQGGKRLAVGWDCRLSSPRFAEAFVTGAVQAGVTAIEIGMVPTPVLYFTAIKERTDGAVQITGSHNPPEYNGFKLMLGEEAVYGEQIQEIQRIIAQQDWRSAQGERLGLTDVLQHYVDWIAGHIHPGSRSVKVVVDGGNGMAGPAILPLLKRLGVEVIALYCEPDGTFPNHHPDPTLPESLSLLSERVLAEGADFGVGYDGDADRIGVVDEGGRTLWGDMLMVIFARSLLVENPGATIVGEVKCSQTLFDDIAAHGGNPLMWKVGHSLIKAKMKEVGALLAGEMSGHIFFAHRYFGFDDAIYATARLVELVSRTEAPLSSLVEGIPRTYVTPELRLEMPDDAVKFEVAARVARELAERQAPGVKEVVTVDGVRVVYQDGWGLIRASNTQPVLVLRAEATSQFRRDEIEADLRARVARTVSQVSR
ncbi:MAG: phosphomannomutase/phosphoglucomutase [Bradymonadales bacterium]|nr:phosphomannomutase/phosphoglucomutase [Bradymonadales bacterium]